MKKSDNKETEIPKVPDHIAMQSPSAEDIDKDISKILNLLESIDIADLSTNTNITELSKDINKKLEGMSEKYKPLIDYLEDEQEKEDEQGK
jgi:hypothetical protein|tara:strand:+ start:8 stop:280 length:273 start_codon:yes stop_codon:yes gene_type:complete